MTGRATALLGLALAFSGCAPPPPPDAASAPGLPVAVLNDLRTSAGRLENGSLVVALDVVDAAWTPRGPAGPRIAVPAFAERGQAPVVPAPLIRLSAGTPLRLTLRNTRAEPVRFGSLLDDADYPGASGVQLEPGETREVHWTPKAPVSSTYGLAATEGPPGASVGAIVVDPAGTQPHPDERVLLLSSWGSPAEPTSLDPAFSWKMLVNGRSWPYTERFEFTVGDTVRWRVINASPEWHPMHLHGFYFRVTSTGDSRADTVFDASTSREVVTHTLAPAGTMSLTFVPSEPGNWLFHCHLLRHMGPTQRFAGDATHGDDAAHGDESDGSTTMEDGMAGMIVGITVRATPGSSEMVEAPARRLDLWTASQPGVFGDAPRLAFVQQEGDAVPPSDSAPTLSSLLVLEQNQTVEIEVHNRLTGPLSVHWHGLELKSQYDGVGHWSGMPGMPRPPIPPGGTALVHLKPPRAGTFIYHTHGEDGSELAQGLYGPLIVLPPGEAYDGERDRIFVLGAGGVGRDADPAVNGVREPPPERFEAGRTYRLRFIQIGADEGKRIELRHEGAPVSWRALAKDGADLAEPLRVTGPARVRADVGETYDFEWAPPSDGVYQLVVKTLSYPIDFDRGPTQTIAFAVGNVTDAAIDGAHEGFDGVMSVATINRLIQGAMVVVLALLGWGMWRLVQWARRRRAPAVS